MGKIIETYNSSVVHGYRKLSFPEMQEITNNIADNIIRVVKDDFGYDSIVDVCNQTFEGFEILNFGGNGESMYVESDKSLYHLDKICTEIKKYQDKIALLETVIASLEEKTKRKM